MLEDTGILGGGEYTTEPDTDILNRLLPKKQVFCAFQIIVSWISSVFGNQGGNSLFILADKRSKQTQVCEYFISEKGLIMKIISN